jgi:Uma2 family endonuclease
MTKIVLTYEDFAALPDDGKRYEHWIVDPDARTIEAYRLEGSAYRLAGKLEGAEPRALPPFPDLLVDPATIWP